MNKFLIIINKTLSSLCVRTVIDKYKAKDVYLDIIITGKKNQKKILTAQVNLLFKKYNKNIHFIYIKKIDLFTLNNFFKWHKIFKLNIVNYNFITNKLITCNILNNKYDQIFFSNEYISKYIIKIFQNISLKKIFIIHGIGDIEIFRKKNIFFEFKNYLFRLINEYINRIKLVHRKDEFYTVFKKYINLEYNSNNINQINIQNYKKYLNLLTKNENKQNKFLKQKFIVYLINFPGFKKKIYTKDELYYINNYLEYQFKEVNFFINKNFKKNKVCLILKTKPYINLTIDKILRKKSKLVFKKINYQIMTRYSKNFVYIAESLIINNNCTHLISKNSTALYNTKILNPKIDIILLDRILKKINNKLDFYNKKNINYRSIDMYKYLKRINVKKI